MNRIDLHTHSNCSDGSLTPRELANLAKERGVSAFALTDHDTFGGLPECLRAAQENGTELIFGIELSAVFQGTEIHILGYFFHNDFNRLAPLKTKLEQLKSIREKRNLEMIERFQSSGIDITYSELLGLADGGVVTRAHFAALLLDKGFVPNFQEAFKTYLSKGCKTYIPREITAPEELFELITLSGGISVLAHPTLYGLDREGIEKLTSALAKLGLGGIEAVYSRYHKLHEEELRRLAKKYGLRISGGSDFHGALKPNIFLGDGTEKTAIPYKILEDLRNGFITLS